jgi:hypothetical protein
MAIYSRRHTKLIRLFGETSPEQVSSPRSRVRMIAINSAAAAACTVSALLWFGIAFAAEESRREDQLAVKMLLWSIPLIIALLGVAARVASKGFPWLATMLTPLFMSLIMELQADREAYFGFRLGACGSAVFLIGALASLQLERWVRSRRSSDNSDG